MLPGEMLLWHFEVKSFVKMWTVPAEQLFGRKNVTDTWNLLKIIPETQVLKFGQNCDRNRSDIADIEFAVGGGSGVQSHFHVKPTLGWVGILTKNPN